MVQNQKKKLELLGHEKAESFMKKITRTTTTTTTKNKAALTSDEQNQVKDMFRESLTFD